MLRLDIVTEQVLKTKGKFYYVIQKSPWTSFTRKKTKKKTEARKRDRERGMRVTRQKWAITTSKRLLGPGSPGFIETTKKQEDQQE